MLVVLAFWRPRLVRRLRRGFGFWFDRQYPKPHHRERDRLLAWRALNSRRSSPFLPVHGLPPAAFTASIARVRLTMSLSRPFGSRRRYMPGHLSSGTMSGGKVLFFGVAGPCTRWEISGRVTHVWGYEPGSLSGALVTQAESSGSLRLAGRRRRAREGCCECPSGVDRQLGGKPGCNR